MADPLAAAQDLYDEALAAQSQYRFTEFGDYIAQTRDAVARAEPGPQSSDRDRWRDLHIRVNVTWSWHAFDADGLPAALESLAKAQDEATQWGRSDLLGAVLFQRATILSRAGHHADAVAVARDAAGLRASMPLASQAKVTLNWALLESWTGDLVAAVARNEEASRLARAAGLSQLEFSALHNGGYMEFLRGNLTRALTLMDAADAMDVDIDRSVARLDHARVLMDAGLLDEARVLLSTAAELAAANGSDHDVAECELETARCELLRAHPQQSLAWARRARHRFVARRESGWRLRATLAELDALAALPGRHASRARLATALYSACLAAGDTLAANQAALARAEALIDSGVAQDDVPWEEAGALRDSPQIAVRLHYGYVAAKYAVSGGDVETARDELTVAAGALATAQRESASIDLRTALSSHGQALAELDCQLSIERGDPADVLERVDRWRGVLRGQPSLRPPLDRAEADLLARLRNLRDEERTLSGEALTAAQGEIDEIARTIRGYAWRALAADDDRGAAGSFSLSAVTDAVVQRQVTILALARATDGFAFVEVSPSGRCILHPVRESGPILESVRRVRADLVAASRLPSGHPLSGPVRSSLAHTLDALDEVLLPRGCRPQELVVLPPQELAFVPWTMLPRLRGVPVTVATTAMGWATGGTVVTHPTVTAIAGPELAEADAEARAVAHSWPGGTLVGSRDSTRAGLISALAECDVVHVAAHGEHQPENPMFSTLRMGDGVVFAHEFEEHRLRASLAVLSACDAGRVTIRPGDEGLGLTASLREIGVDTVIAPLTPVPDGLAREVMSDVHARLAAGQAGASAVASACSGRDLLAASFTTFGNPWRATRAGARTPSLLQPPHPSS